MTELTGVARHLRLSEDRLRVAADLLQQGYHPAFIERYRADETSCLSRDALWTLKLELDRQARIQVSREKALKQLPKDAVLDTEGQEHLATSQTESDIETTLKCYRARRQHQHEEIDANASKLIEKMVAFQGSTPADITAWAASELQVDNDAASKALESAQELAGRLMLGDTKAVLKMRGVIQRKAQVTVELLNPNSAEASNEKPTEQKAANAKAGDDDTSESPAATAPAVDDGQSVAASDNESVEATSAEPTVESTTPDPTSSASVTTSSNEQTVAADEGSDQTAVAPVGDQPEAEVAESVSSDAAEPVEQATEPLAAEEQVDHAADESDGQSTDGQTDAKQAGKGKNPAKMTPRQRRRRWLVSMLQPMKSIKKPLAKLTAYQQLMLARGRRSQLAQLHLNYDKMQLQYVGRDTFVNQKHPFARWFGQAVDKVLDETFVTRLENDAIAEFEERAQQSLLETAAERLRQNLMRRPVRGHNILLIDTVGPKTVAVIVIDSQGKLLARTEIPCAAQPEVVSQNVVKLGELVHKHRVTLVALSNGPARRFMVLTLRELIKQSEGSGLRWTMADRGGAEAYAGGRTALRELSEHNRRDRAAIWIARCLQDPLSELLRIDINRLRLGSYQRELPQGPLKQLVRDTIADCVCQRGLDARNASADELAYLPGVEPPQAQQIEQLARRQELKSREQLLSDIPGWDELGKRQAISWLRVFESENQLDATAIHPDDYKLAERVISNTELEAPPAAPEGWIFKAEPIEENAAAVAPVAADDVVEAADDTAADDTVAEVADAESTESVGEGETPQDGSENSEAPAAESGAEEPASTDAEAATVTEAAAESNAESAEASDGTAGEQVEAPAADVSVEAPASDDAGEAAEASDEAATATETAPVAASEEQPKPKAAESETPAPQPEYPEDVAAQQPVPSKIDVEKTARGWQVGREKLRLISQSLQDPFADPRLSQPPVPMLSSMPTLETLEPGTCLWAVVVGVADFGAFVELSPDCSGLIHISRMSSGYVEDPHQCVQVGDVLMTWVVSIDKSKNRVALTALSPEERQVAEQKAASERESRSGRGDGRPQRGGQGGGRAGQGQRGGAQGGRGGQGQRGGGRGDRGGQQSRGGGRGPGRGGDRGRGRGQGRPAKTIVVESKKPKEAISDAMKEGDEPLRSFSDLLQFYDAKRTEPPEPKGEVKPAEAKENVSSEAPQSDEPASSGSEQTPESESDQQS